MKLFLVLGYLVPHITFLDALCLCSVPPFYFFFSILSLITIHYPASFVLLLKKLLRKKIKICPLIKICFFFRVFYFKREVRDYIKYEKETILIKRANLLDEFEDEEEDEVATVVLVVVVPEVAPVPEARTTPGKPVTTWWKLFFCNHWGMLKLD
jgi:hypothetical protein